MRRDNSRERAILDRISASRMHLPAYLALSATSAPATLRFKFQILGIDPEEPGPRNILDLLDQLGAQEMLNGQPVGIRYAAVEREIKGRRVWR